MVISDLQIKDCDLSFFIQSEGDNFMQEIQWLEENDFEDLDNSPLAIKTENESKFSFKPYPNPFDQQFMLSFENMDESSPLTVAITNLSGTVLWVNTYKLNSKNGILTVHPELSLASGKYNLRVSQPGQVQISSLISK